MDANRRQQTVALARRESIMTSLINNIDKDRKDRKKDRLRLEGIVDSLMKTRQLEIEGKKIESDKCTELWRNLYNTMQKEREESVSVLTALLQSAEKDRQCQRKDRDIRQAERSDHRTMWTAMLQNSENERRERRDARVAQEKELRARKREHGERQALIESLLKNAERDRKSMMKLLRGSIRSEKTHS